MSARRRDRGEPRRGNSILGGTAWQVAAQVAPLVVNLALTPFVITTLGREAYGLWLVMSTFTNFVGQVDGGINRTVLRYFSAFAGIGGEKARTEAGRYTKSLTVVVLAIGTVVLLPFIVLAGPVVDFFHAPPELRGGAIFFVRASLVIIAVALWRNILASILNAYDYYGLTAITHLASYIVYAVTLVVALPRGWGLDAMAWAAIGQGVIATLWVVPNALRLVTLRGSGWMTWPEIREFAMFAWKVQVSGLLTMLSFQGVTLVVGRAAPRQVPDFGPGATFAQQLRVLPQTATRPIQSRLGQVYGRGGQDEATARMIPLQRVWVVFIVGWVAVGAPAAMNGVNSWLPLESDLAGQIAAILLLGHLFALLPMVLLQYLMITGHPEYEMWSAVVSVVVMIGLAALVAGPFGAEGVAVASVIGQLLGMVVLLALASRRGLVPRNPLRDIPWVAALVCSALGFLTTGLVAHAVADGPLEGPLGLLLVAAAAAPPFLLYLVWTVGWGRTKEIIRTRRLV